MGKPGNKMVSWRRVKEREGTEERLREKKKECGI